MNKKTYFIKGIHCSSCEIIITEKLKSEYSFSLQNQTIVFTKKAPTAQNLNKLFQKEGYEFSETPFKSQKWLESLVIGFSIIAIFFFINKLGVTNLFNVNATTTLPGFFIFGLLAGVSTCAALTGGLLLSVSDNWEDKKPFIQFSLGRLFSFTLLGLSLGLIGQSLQFSPTLIQILIITVSIIMLVNGLKMLGLNSLNINLFKSLNFKNRAPTVLGFLTVLLPCGFTLTAESLSLLSGNPLTGSLIMFLFALGTLPGLLIISLASLKLNLNKAVGILIIFFALFNFNSQFNIISTSNPPVSTTTSDEKQIIAMEASSFGYEPNYIKIPAGKPVVWEIKDTGTSGCTNAIIAPSLFKDRIALTPGQTSVKEFTAPNKPGKYKFSCWMGMINGYFEVI